MKISSNTKMNTNANSNAMALLRDEKQNKERLSNRAFSVFAWRRSSRPASRARRETGLPACAAAPRSRPRGARAIRADTVRPRDLGLTRTGRTGARPPPRTRPAEPTSPRACSATRSSARRPRRLSPSRRIKASSGPRDGVDDHRVTRQGRSIARRAPGVAQPALRRRGPADGRAGHRRAPGERYPGRAPLTPEGCESCARPRQRRDDATRRRRAGRSGAWPAHLTTARPTAAHRR